MFMSNPKQGQPLPPSPSRITKEQRPPGPGKEKDKKKVKFPHKGKVNGLARRKGESGWKPWKYGFNIDDSLKDHPKWQKPLPPLKTPPKKGNARDEGGERKGIGQALKGMFFGGKKK
jgi:hypothetical protein